MKPTLPVAVDVVEDGGFGLQPITNRGVRAGGVELRLTEWEGWHDTPDVRANPVDVPGGDGAYDDEPLFSGRTIILKGVALAGDPADLLRVAGDFERLLAGQWRRGTVSVAELSAPPRTCRVRLGGRSVFKLTHPGRAEWSLSLYAARPYRAGPVKTLSTGPFQPSGGLSFPWKFPLRFGAAGSSGAVVCVNDGTIPAPVRLVIAGQCTNPVVTLVETGERLAFQTAVARLDVDTEDRSVLRDGSAAWGWTATSDSSFFWLPAESASTLRFRVDAGVPTLTVSWSDTTP